MKNEKPVIKVDLELFDAKLKKIAVLEKALDLACGFISCCLLRVTQKEWSDYFIKLAEKDLEEESK